MATFPAPDDLVPDLFVQMPVADAPVTEAEALRILQYLLRPSYALLRTLHALLRQTRAEAPSVLTAGQVLPYLASAHALLEAWNAHQGPHAVRRRTAAGADALEEASRPPPPPEASSPRWTQRVGQRIQTAREAAGLSRTQLARRIGRTPRLLRRIEQGPHPRVAVSLLMVIAAELGVPFAALVARPDAAPAAAAPPPRPRQRDQDA
jgi:hypothetical protein